MALPPVLEKGLQNYWLKRGIRLGLPADVHLKELSGELGGLDLFIISAGMGELNEMLDFELEQRTIDTNIYGFTYIADWAFHFFQKQESGHLVGITSVAGIRGNRVAPAYNASKAYQINYLEGFRQKANKWND